MNDPTENGYRYDYDHDVVRETTLVVDGEEYDEEEVIWIVRQYQSNDPCGGEDL